MGQRSAHEPTPPPGWYPAPDGSGQQRWWNGQAWGAPATAPPPSTGSSRNTGRRYAWTAAAAVGVILFVGVVTTGSETEDSGRASSSTPSTPSTTEGKLAALAGDGLTDSAARPYAMALDNAEPVCTQSREGIGDIVYAGQQSAESHGVDVSTLELLRAIPGSVPEDLRPTSCCGIVAAIVALMLP